MLKGESVLVNNYEQPAIRGGERSLVSPSSFPILPDVPTPAEIDVRRRYSASVMQLLVIAVQPSQTVKEYRIAESSHEQKKMVQRTHALEV
jgi:hypothetical protein